MNSTYKKQNRAHSVRILSVLIAAMSIFGAATVFADGPSNGDDYSSPSPGAAATAKEQIARDAANIACTGNLCTLFSVTVNKTVFNVTTYVGTGQMQPANSDGNTNNYYGGVNTGTTTGNATGIPGYGVQLTWAKTKCTKNVNVDKSVYDSVTTYMKSLVGTTAGEDPTFPQFTPAEQTMILFYTTVMDLTKGSTCN